MARRAATDPLFTDVARTYRRLRAESDAGTMLALAADLLRTRLDLDACLCLAVTPDGLSTRGTAPLADPTSDALRRRLLGAPVTLTSGSIEAAVVDAAAAAEDPRVRGLPSALSAQLALPRVAVAPIAPDDRTLGLVVGLREGDDVDDETQMLLWVYTQAVSAALDLVVMRMRAGDLLGEVRRAATTIQALAREMSAEATILPADRGFGSLTFPGGADASTADGPGPVEDLGLTPAEARIAALLVDGHSNREIAADLVLSPETVKTHVSHILRKLGVTNRAEAVATLVRRGR